MEISEILAAAAALMVGAKVWLRWFIGLLGVNHLVAKPGRRWVGPAALASYLIINFVVLRTLAAEDVRDAPTYVVFYLMLAFGASAVALTGLRTFGIHPADISQRGNRAAGVFVVLAMIGAGFAFAGANIGDGPGFHVVLFCAALSYGAMFLLLLAHVAIGRGAYRILVEQDLGAALRTGAMVVACGICLGRAVAGDWNGAESAVADFVHRSWPALGLCATDIVVTRTFRGNGSAAATALGAIAGLVYIGAAVAYVRDVGIPT